MKENKYDDPSFFEQYAQMNRSLKGLEGAGEWHILQKMLPDFTAKKVLDLGCGFGWHCRYAIEHGASSAIGVDISEKMLERAQCINQLPGITYIKCPLEEVDYSSESFDVVISSLAFHYIQSFDVLCERIYGWLKPGGSFVFSVEHPVYSACGSQDWMYGESREKLCWPVDNYFIEGPRKVVFLGEKVTKYHRTFTSYLNSLLKVGFYIKEIIEPEPSKKMREEIAGMEDELRRPMMLLVSVVKELKK